MKHLLFKLFFIFSVSALFSSELYAQNIVRQYRRETGIPDSFILVTEYDNGNSLVVTYALCSQCKGTKKCGACYGQGGVYIGSMTGYMPCIACGRTGICGACDSDGLRILGSMMLDSQGNTLASSSLYGGSSETGSNHNSSKRSTCRHCNGTGYFLQQSSTPGTFIDHAPFYNSSGNKCKICGGYNTHWHLQCKH